MYICNVYLTSKHIGGVVTAIKARGGKMIKIDTNTVPTAFHVLTTYLSDL